ncbi:MAG TPA: hypothetical protein VM689_08290 [Aliidongia sp.]|nr:hypothetical protein [Aliidongia sp.]
MAADIVPPYVLQQRRSERLRARTLASIATLRADLDDVSYSLHLTRETLEDVSASLGRSVAQLQDSRQFATQCDEIMTIQDIDLMIAERDSLLLSDLAATVLDRDLRSRHLARLSPAAR